MAVRIDAAGDYLSRTTSLPTVDPFTVCFWFYMVADRNAIGSIFLITNSAGTVYQGLTLSTNGTLLRVSTSGGNTNGTNLSTATWYHLAYTRNGSTHLSYLNGVQDASLTSSISLTPFSVVLGSDSVNWCNARFFDVKIWDNAVLGAAEIIQEMNIVCPKRTDNIHLFSPILIGDRTTDYSGQGRNWTENGSLTDEQSPGIIWNSAPFVKPVVVGATNQNAPVDLGDSLAVGNNVNFSPGSINATVDKSDAPAIGNAVDSDYIQAIGLADALAIGLNSGFAVGSVTSTVNKSDALAIGYDLTTGQIKTVDLADSVAIGIDSNRAVGSVNSPVNNSDALAVGLTVDNDLIQPMNKSDALAIGNNTTANYIQVVGLADATAVGLSLSANQIQSLGNAVSAAIGYDAGFTVGSISVGLGFSDAIAIGYNIPTEDQQIIDVNLADGTAVGNSLSTRLIQAVNNALSTAIGYDLTNSYIILVNKADGLSIGNGLNTHYIQVINLADSLAAGNNINAQLVYLVNAAIADATGNEVGFTYGATTKQVSSADAIALGYLINLSSFVIILSPHRLYVPKSDNRVYEVEENRIYSPIDDRIFEAKNG